MLLSELELRRKSSALASFLAELNALNLNLEDLKGLLLASNENSELSCELEALSFLVAGLGDLNLGIQELEAELLCLNGLRGGLSGPGLTLIAFLERLDTSALLKLASILKKQALTGCSSLSLLSPAL